MIGHHDQVPLSETTLRKAAGDLIYARGEDYVRYVRGLRTTAPRPTRRSRLKKVYTVELDWSGPSLIGSCTCPHHADGNFCKHLVATGLAAIDTGRILVDETASSTVEAAVQAMDVGELRELVMTLAQRDDGVRRMLEVRATAVSGDDSQAKAELEAMREMPWPSEALSTTGVPSRSRRRPVTCSTNSKSTSIVDLPNSCVLRSCTR